VAANRHTAAFVGFGQSRIFRGPDVPLGQLTVEASRAAVEETGLDIGEIDGVVCTPDPPFAMSASADGTEYVTTEFLSTALGLEPRWRADVPGTIGNSAKAAIEAVEAGRCQYALLFRALHNPGSGVYGHTDETEAGKIETPGLDSVQYLEQFRAPYGLYPPADAGALPWSRYQAKYRRGTREQMATLVVQSRENGLLYPGSYWAQYKPVPLSVEEYLGARMVSRPVSIFDCDLPVQGAAAFVITTAERAQALAQPPAYVLGVAGGTKPRGTVTVDESWDELLADDREIGRRLWADSGHRPDDVDLANLYDGFSMMTIAWLEGLGLCGEGEAFDFIQDGRIARTGALPVNPSGGNLGGGRLHGVNHLMDGMLQVTGRGEARQVADARLAVVAVGMGWTGAAFLFGGDPA